MLENLFFNSVFMATILCVAIQKPSGYVDIPLLVGITHVTSYKVLALPVSPIGCSFSQIHINLKTIVRTLNRVN